MTKGLTTYFFLSFVFPLLSAYSERLGKAGRGWDKRVLETGQRDGSGQINKQKPSFDAKIFNGKCNGKLQRQILHVQQEK